MSNDFPASERYLAIREGHFNADSEAYFEARPHRDTPQNRRIFYAGHCKGYDAAMEKPIDMVLFCPNCGKQHIDAPDDHPELRDIHKAPWTNPPHRSHLCHECGCIWRPADVPTNGVAAITTKGQKDTWVGKAPLAAPLKPNRCAGCGTTENLHRNYGFNGPWRCDSDDCIPY